MTETPRRHGFPSNRRDGARLLSTVLVVAGASLIRIDHPVGRILFLVSGVLSLYWWTLYRRLPQ
jgi:hypothetical protein